MGYVSKAGLQWAIQQLRGWSEKAKKQRNLKSLPRLFILKANAVGTAPTPLTTSRFSDTAKRFFQVSFANDPTVQQTGGIPRYFDPFSQAFNKMGVSDWAVGTLWTRSDIWQKQGFLNYSDQEDKRAYSFPEDYEKQLAEYLGTTIPILPAAIFFLRRPTDCNVDVSKVENADDLIKAFLAAFNFAKREVQVIFSQEGEQPGNLLVSTEMDRSEALSAIESVTPFENRFQETLLGTESAAQSIAGPVGALEPEQVASEVELLGLDAALAAAAAALDSGQHIILIGPPGTGKTTVAKALAARWSTAYVVHTATSEWSTFETIGGYMPSESGALEFMPGLILEAIRDNNWLIIDELNRADIDKAFGELFTLLTAGEVLLAYAKEPGSRRIRIIREGVRKPEALDIVMKPTWRLIGTMNSLDKASLHQLSYAFMRRFIFIEVGVPELAQYRQILVQEIEKYRTEAKVAAGSFADEFLNRTGEIYFTVFASPKGLATRELQVGPGIPLAMLRYTKRRCNNFVDVPPLQADQAFIEACTGMLLPQFEGRRATHPRLVAGLTSWATDEEAAEISGILEKKLSIWVGDFG